MNEFSLLGLAGKPWPVGGDRLGLAGKPWPVGSVLSVSSVLVIHDQLRKGHRRNTAERSPERRALAVQFTTSYGEKSDVNIVAWVMSKRCS